MCLSFSTKEVAVCLATIGALYDTDQCAIFEDRVAHVSTKAVKTESCALCCVLYLSDVECHVRCKQTEEAVEADGEVGATEVGNLHLIPDSDVVWVAFLHG